MIIRVKEREEARRLRHLGYSMRQIEASLGVSRASVSFWVRDVKLSKEQKENLNKRNPALNNDSKSRKKGSISNSQYALNLRKQYQEEGRILARQRNPHFIAGIMLYWAEGGKTRNKNSIRLNNSDVEILKFFLLFLQNFLGVEKDKISIRIDCHINNGLTVEEIEKYWLNNLGLERNNLRKTHIVYTSAKRKKNIHLYGICDMRVSNTRAIQKIFGAIQEFVGFENKNWIMGV